MPNTIKLQQGECKLDNAPFVQFDSGQSCIPQHYLTFSHTRESVESIVLDIEYSDAYPVYVGVEDESIYIQIGIIGHDNYKKKDDSQSVKIVYGRKWRVEPELPTSEIIQTVFLALKVAREHEVRELLKFNYHSIITTPFNNHQDLPALSYLQPAFSAAKHDDINEQAISDVLALVSYDGAVLKLTTISAIDKQWLVQIHVECCPKSLLAELKAESGIDLTFLIKGKSINLFLFELMEQLLQLSNHQVAENFRYRGYRRFSRDNEVLVFASLSAKMRNKTTNNSGSGFTTMLKSSNYKIDKGRVPCIYNGVLAKKHALHLAAYQNIDGILPHVIEG